MTYNETGNNNWWTRSILSQNVWFYSRI